MFLDYAFSFNEAVKKTPAKFPDGYLLVLSDESWEFLRSKTSTLKDAGRGKRRKYKSKPRPLGVAGDCI